MAQKPLVQACPRRQVTWEPKAMPHGRCFLLYIWRGRTAEEEEIRVQGTRTQGSGDLEYWRAKEKAHEKRVWRKTGEESSKQADRVKSQQSKTKHVCWSWVSAFSAFLLYLTSCISPSQLGQMALNLTTLYSQILCK